MFRVVSSCVKSIESLRRLQDNIVPNSWADCNRLCIRSEVFASLVMELKNFPNMLEETDEHEQELIIELEKTLVAAEAYVADFVTRTSFKGVTEPSFRQGSSSDFAKISQKLTKLSQDLSIVQDFDYDQMRQEDLEDQKIAFKYAFSRVLDEISRSNPVEYEINFNNLRKDIESYPHSIGKFLALNKHMGLTVNETKALKADIDWMKSNLDQAYQHSENYTSPAESNESRNFENPNNNKDLQMNTELVVRLVQGDQLNNDQYSQKMKMLAELRLPQDDVIISKVRIGQGGFGDVFLGTFRRRYKVAIKTIRNVDDPYAENKKKSIENELLLMKFLGSYPTILSCYGYVMREGSLQIVLELAPFGSLDHMLRDKNNYRTFPLSLMIAWLCDLADAIKFLHSREIKHRDIKAENMLVFERFRIKLCDFGPAKQHIANITAESKVGTFCFMAPEIRIGQVSEFASDIFSFAMTAIQILSRKTPRIDDFKGQVVETLMQLQIPYPEVNQKLHSLLSSCVQYDPEVHPNMLRPTAEVVSRELVEVLEMLGGDPREESSSDMMRELETVARRKESERLRPAGSTSIFRPQSGSMSRKNSPLLALALSNDRLGLGSSSFRAESSDAITTYTAQTNGQSLYDLGASQMISGIYDKGGVISSNSLFGSFASQDNDDKISLMNFLRHQVNCTQSDSQLIADMLVKNGCANIDILRRRLTRNEDYLLDLGVEENVAEDIYHEVVMNGRGNGSSASSSAAGTPTASHYKSHNTKRRNALSPLTDILPTEISRLYYDAAQCNRTEALEKLKEIAEKGDKLAECFLMRMYALGQGSIKKDVEKAQALGNELLPWLKDAIDSGNDMYLMYVRYLIGVCYSEGLGTKQDQREAVRWCRLSAEQGYAAAQAYLGYCCFAGMGVPRNLEEAVRWYRMSADQGYAGAQCNLGLCYEHGYGVVMNLEEAVKWYRLSADQGDAAALFNLGYCYEKGLGVIEDSQDAVRYYKLSAGYGYTAAQYNLGVCYYFGTGVDQNMEEAVMWYRVAADKGYAPAQCNLGLCYENGHGIEQDYVEATYWYRQAAEQGHPAALYYLGFCYFSGMGVSKNIEEAVHYYKLSAEKKYPPAQNNLGFCYFNGLGVPKNYTIAVKWYRLAAEQGYAPAQYNMGYCYEKGYGVVTKLHAVIRWYRLAAENGNEKAKKALTRFQG